MDRSIEGRVAALQVAVSYALAMASKANPTADFVAEFKRNSDLVNEQTLERVSEGNLTSSEASDIAAAFTATLKDVTRLADAFISDLS